MAYKGRFKPRNPQKYMGNPTNIIYRSNWEQRVMAYFDRSDSIISWASEEFFIPYKSPIDGRWHRYYPDFLVKMKEKDGSVRVRVMEIKPNKQTKPPERRSKITRKYLQEVATWGINSSKWEAAKNYCADRKWEFVILTEKELGI